MGKIFNDVTRVGVNGDLSKKDNYNRIKTEKSIELSIISTNLTRQA